MTFEVNAAPFWPFTPSFLQHYLLFHLFSYSTLFYCWEFDVLEVNDKIRKTTAAHVLKICQLMADLLMGDLLAICRFPTGIGFTSSVSTARQVYRVVKAVPIPLLLASKPFQHFREVFLLLTIVPRNGFWLFFTSDTVVLKKEILENFIYVEFTK